MTPTLPPSGLSTPRDPLTTSEALWSVALSLVVGPTAGFVFRSRWATLAAPLAEIGP